MRDDILSLIIAPVPTEYTGQLPTDGLELLDEDNGFGVIEVDGLGREDINVNSVQLAGLDVSAYQSTRMQSRPINILFDYLTNGARKTLRNALPWGEPRRLYITMDDGEGVHSTYWIDVYAENIPLKVTTGTTGSTLTLIALDPFFRSLERRSKHLVFHSMTEKYFCQNTGDAPAYPIWDFSAFGSSTWTSRYTGTDGTEKTLRIEVQNSYLCKNPYIRVCDNEDFIEGVKKFALSGLLAGVYVNFEPGRRECRSAKINDPEQEDYAYELGSISTNPQPLWEAENYLDNDPSSVIDPCAEEAFEKEVASFMDVANTDVIFAPIAPLSEWVSISPGGSYIHIRPGTRQKPDSVGTLLWYDTYTAI